MKLPNNSVAFKSIVIEKVKTYCDTKIWPYSFEQFAAWLNNFDDDLEEYLALQIIDNLIVRSNSMAKSGYARLFNSKIRPFLLENTDILIDEIADRCGFLATGIFYSSFKKYYGKPPGMFRREAFLRKK